MADVRDDSPAGDQGLAPGDVITEINGAEGDVRSTSFGLRVGKVKSGDYVHLYVRRFRRRKSRGS